MTKLNNTKVQAKQVRELNAAESSQVVGGAVILKAPRGPGGTDPLYSGITTTTAITAVAVYY